MRVALTSCAHGAMRTQGTQGAGFHHHVAAHNGYKRSILATANKLLRTIYAVLRIDEHCCDPGMDDQQLELGESVVR